MNMNELEYLHTKFARYEDKKEQMRKYSKTYQWNESNRLLGECVMCKTELRPDNNEKMIAGNYMIIPEKAKCGILKDKYRICDDCFRAVWKIAWKKKFGSTERSLVAL